MKTAFFASPRMHAAASVVVAAAFVLVDTAAAQGGKIYWPTSDGHTIRKVLLDGTCEESLESGYVTSVNRLALDAAGGKIYWPSIESETIRRANLDGTGEEDLATSTVFVYTAIVLDAAGGKIYWVSPLSNTIRRANLDGTGEEDLATSSVNSETLLVLDATGGKIYWPSFESQTIRRVNLDGTGEEVISSSVVSPFITRLVLDPAPTKGACCVNGVCLDLSNASEAVCLAAGGTYLGNGSECASESCPTGGCPEDLNGNGAVDFGDLVQLLSSWGPCP